MNLLYINGISDDSATRLMLQGDAMREITDGDFWVPDTGSSLWSEKNKKRYVTEVIPVSIAAHPLEMFQLENQIYLANHQSWRWHSDSTRQDSLWLYWRVAHEPRAKRALIRSLEWEPDSITDSYLTDEIRKGDLRIERYHWENVEAFEHEIEHASLLGGMVDIANVGTLASRISLLQMVAPAASKGLNQVWVGIREARNGHTDFVSFWDASKGRLESGFFDTDGSAKNSQKAVFNFLDSEDLIRRLRLKVGEIIDVGGEISHYVGRYLILARLKVSEANTRIFIQMRYGNAANELKVKHQYLFIEPTPTWQLVPIGELQIPAGVNRINAVNDIRNSEIELWAGRRTGAGKLEIDGLILIPSRHILRIQNQEILSSLTTDIECRTHEDDLMTIEISMSPDGPVYSAYPRSRHFNLPHDGGLFVLAGQRSGVSSLTDTVNLTLRWHPRWVSYMEKERYECY